MEQVREREGEEAKEERRWNKGFTRDYIKISESSSSRSVCPV